MPAALRLQPGQEHLTSEQEAEAKRFAEERIAAQLSVEPVDERIAEEWLRQSCAAAQLPQPSQIVWVDGPLQLVARLADLVGNSDLAQFWDSVANNVGESGGAVSWVHVQDNVWDHVRACVGSGVINTIWESVLDSVSSSVWDNVGSSIWGGIRADILEGVWYSRWASIRAYDDAQWLAAYYYFDVNLAPHKLGPLARFNELVSGYWLTEADALVVRRPHLLTRDSEGRLHNATGPCLEYPDGWGFWAWHGVRVPENVILTPERLTRADFLGASNVEVRRVIQERMGERFVGEIGGVLVHASAFGQLYAVTLPADDPEREARYVHVHDATTPRHYFLQVPPSMQTADEAVAWTFRLTFETYRPQRET